MDEKGDDIFDLAKEKLMTLLAFGTLVKTY